MPLDTPAIQTMWFTSRFLEEAKKLEVLYLGYFRTNPCTFQNQQRHSAKYIRGTYVIYQQRIFEKLIFGHFLIYFVLDDCVIDDMDVL